MENQRPKLTDPKEYALIKDIYFEKDSFRKALDPIERLERSNSKIKNLNKSSR